MSSNESNGFFGGLGGLGGFSEGIDKITNSDGLNLLMMGLALMDNGRKTVNGPRPLAQVIGPFLARQESLQAKNMDTEAWGMALKGAGVPDAEISKLARNPAAAKQRIDQIRDQRNMQSQEKWMNDYRNLDKEGESGGSQSAPTSTAPAGGTQRSEAAPVRNASYRATADENGYINGAPASLISNESGGRWNAQNNAMGAGGQRGHFGRIQFGHARLAEAKAAGAIPADMTPQQFMASPEAQVAAERWHWSDIDNHIRRTGLDKRLGETLLGVPVTMEGMRAVAHLGGKGGLTQFMETNGRYNAKDANNTRLSDYFRRHGGVGRRADAETEDVPGRVTMAQGPSDTMNDADPIQIDQQRPVQTAQAGSTPGQARVEAIPGDNPTELRKAAAALKDSNPEAARQLLLRADMAEGKIPTTQAAAQATDVAVARPAPAAQNAPVPSAPAPRPVPTTPTAAQARPVPTRLGVPVRSSGLNGPVSPVGVDNPGVLDFFRLQAEGRGGNTNTAPVPVARQTVAAPARVAQSDEVTNYPVAPVTTSNLAPATNNQPAAPAPAPAPVSPPAARPSAMTPKEMMATPDWQTVQASDEEFNKGLEQARSGPARREAPSPQYFRPGPDGKPVAGPAATPSASVATNGPQTAQATANDAPPMPTPGSPEAQKIAEKIPEVKYSQGAMDPTQYKDGSNSQKRAMERKLQFLAGGIMRGSLMGEGGKGMVEFSKLEYQRIAKNMEPTDLEKNVDTIVAGYPKEIRAQAKAELMRNALPDSRPASLQELDRIRANPDQLPLLKDLKQSGVQQTPPPINPLVTKMSDQFVESRKAASGYKDVIRSVHNARDALDGDKGAYLGFGAPTRLQAAKLGQLFGVDNTEKIAATEKFEAAIGQAVLDRAGALGANPSNADRDYIKAIQAGDIKLDEKSVRAILDMQERWGRQVIREYNDRFDTVVKTLETDARKDPNTAQALALTRALGRISEPEEYVSPQERRARANPKPAAAPAAPDPARTTDGWTDYGNGVRVRVKQ